ncbi:hypothetical protein E5A73_19025 [Sphingomonas gei]|uniref:Uncharacterized protein n=1 Tax=Sphingomonas gei TaxID=1395960 RepID=A0A4S1X150_9SPHN|nr:hypothetical protein [Sphingomonas gei]TGX49608.1 hypothetical protein E5A73_19025 [Sphingomonas gei]
MFKKAAARASNEAELERAFRSADKIIVEGDSALREQAERWAKHGPPVSHADTADGVLTGPDGVEPAAAPVGGLRRSVFSVYVWLLFGVLVFVSGAGVLYLNHSTNIRGSPAAAAESQRESLVSMITLLVWPTVALIALCMMFFLARQALTIGSNVRFEWRVTEKVSGKLVITKVRSAGDGQ